MYRNQMRASMNGAKWAILVLCAWQSALLEAGEKHDVWPKLAPGESTRSKGKVQPFRKNELPPVTRVTNITCPTYTVHHPAKPNGSAVVILPGGGFGKVVPDKEGTEAADWLKKHGITSFVVSYRTKGESDANGWHKPLQDGQRMLSFVRANASRWSLDPKRIGLVGFSAGGQVAARLLTTKKRAYDPIDAVDKTSFRPDFAVLIYPWNIYDAKSDRLAEGINISKDCPPTFLVHTDDDRSSSLGAVLFYAQLKRLGIKSALHVYGNGGHGYGLRPIAGSQIATWPSHAGHWLDQIVRK